MTTFFSYQDSGLDDWDPTKNHLQMGFRPGFAVQARELTQMQTLLQNQISALAKRFLNNGSLIDASLDLTSPPNGIGTWGVSLNTGYVYIIPQGKDIGYFVHNNTVLSPDSPVIGDADRNTYVYARIEEVQINPEGNETPAMGGYSRVSVDPTLVDNAQGFANHNAPGASRYQINILNLGSYLEGDSLPVNAVNLFYIKATQGVGSGNIPYYIDTNEPIPFTGG